MGPNGHNNDFKRYINDNTGYCNAFSALMGTKDAPVPVLAAVLATRYSRLVLLASWAGALSKRTCPQLPPATGAVVLVVCEAQQHVLVMG